MNVEEVNFIWKLFNTDIFNRNDYNLDVMIIDMSSLYSLKFPLVVTDIEEASCMSVIINQCINNYTSAEQVKEVLLENLENFNRYLCLNEKEERDTIEYINIVEQRINLILGKYFDISKILVLSNGCDIDLENKNMCYWLSDIQSVLDKDKCLLNCVFSVYTKK